MNRPLSSFMSIAVSAVIRPSKILLGLLALNSVALVFAAAMLISSRIGDLPLYARIFVACFTFLALGSAMNWVIRQRKTVRLDISTNGQIRLVEHNGLTGLLSAYRNKAGGNQVLRLMPDSILWSSLLLLRLHTEEHRVIVLPILRDSTSAEGFRALSVACRWIAAQNNRAEGDAV